MKPKKPKQPNQICAWCGTRYGTKFQDGYFVYHKGSCSVCRKMTQVTDPANFGQIDDAWRNHARA